MRKRAISTICIISAFTLTLCGCGSVYSNYREVEQLLVIETMGFDSLPGGVRLSLSAGMGSGGSKEPIRLTGTGETISAAMDMARNYSFEDELFCSQTNSILIGEATAEQGMEDYLSYICQSPILRTDVPVFIVKGSTAQEAILNTGDGQHGVSEILQGVTEYLEYRGSSHIFKASDLVRSNLRHGSALCCVLEYTDSLEPPVDSSQAEKTARSGGEAADTPEGTQATATPNQDSTDSASDSSGKTENSGGTGSGTDSGTASSEQTQNSGGSSADTQAKTLAVAGYGVLKDNRLISYIDKTQALGVSFLINKVGISVIELDDARGDRVVLEINDGESSLTPVYYKDGSLRRLDFTVDVQATVTEINDYGKLTDESYNEELTAALETYVAERVENVLRLSATLQSDFLSLGAQVEQYDAVLWHMLPEDFAQSLPSLEMRVAVSGELTHTNDMKESLT